MCGLFGVICYGDKVTELSDTISSVIIEHKDFENLINVYDKPNSFFYLDPPYYGTEKYYQVQFSEQDHIRLFNTLAKVKGKFLLSYNDCEYIRELYKGYKIEAVDRCHNLHARYENKEKKYSELIIKNY